VAMVRAPSVEGANMHGPLACRRARAGQRPVLCESTQWRNLPTNRAGSESFIVNTSVKIAPWTRSVEQPCRVTGTVTAEVASHGPGTAGWNAGSAATRRRAHVGHDVAATSDCQHSQ